jgi:hypothetical protein
MIECADRGLFLLLSVVLPRLLGGVTKGGL